MIYTEVVLRLKSGFKKIVLTHNLGLDLNRDSQKKWLTQKFPLKAFQPRARSRRMLQTKGPRRPSLVNKRFAGTTGQTHSPVDFRSRALTDNLSIYLDLQVYRVWEQVCTIPSLHSLQPSYPWASRRGILVEMVSCIFTQPWPLGPDRVMVLMCRFVCVFIYLSPYIFWAPPDLPV